LFINIKQKTEDALTFLRIDPVYHFIKSRLHLLIEILHKPRLNLIILEYIIGTNQTHNTRVNDYVVFIGGLFVELIKFIFDGQFVEQWQAGHFPIDGQFILNVLFKHRTNKFNLSGNLLIFIIVYTVHA